MLLTLKLQRELFENVLCSFSGVKYISLFNAVTFLRQKLLGTDAVPMGTG